MLKQQLNFKLSQKLSPQQIQLMKLIQLPTQAFEQRISQEMNENPALEGGKEETESFDDDFGDDSLEDDFDEGTEIVETEINVDDYLSDDETPGYKLSANNYSADDEEKQMPYAAGTSFTQYLMQQLSTYRLDEEEQEISRFLVGSVDESGYIRRQLIDIVDDLAFTQNVYTTVDKIEKVLRLVQDLDPPGVGARDLQECLLIQLLRKKDSQGVALAISILRDSFEHFSKKHYAKLIQKYTISEDQLRSAIHEIEGLNPKPGGTYAGNNKIVEHVVPDFAITIVEGKLELTLNGRNAPELHVSREYTNMLKGYKEATQKSKSQKDAVQFIKQKLDAAKWFIDAIKQRQQTLFVTMNSIMHHQEGYFLSGDERKLKPMILKDIADKIKMDISTVSRVANSKYVDTPYGTRLIKEFFSESMKNDQGEDVSTKEIKKILEITIGEENKRKPFTDDKLAKLLLEKGYPIARRTVAKYREQLDLPVARLRKEI
ncbi:MAG: RNA polymerase factor sigma-54 [Flavobacteriales bacterium]|tara:strand:+ start:8263 stop:9726 length:1464 start_codon:yes stop_codon:yes gene_type:complete